jgi:tetratricopeptide (TPR) repeat protein
MKLTGFVVLSLLFAFPLSSTLHSQDIPNNPNHLPKMIGGQRSDSKVVSGTIRLDGLPPDQPRPAIFVAVYKFGRLVIRRPVSENGSYSVPDVPNEGVTLVVEIDHAEVANSQIMPSPASIVYQDFNINWLQFEKSKSKPGVINAAAVYERNSQNQQRFDGAISDIKKGKYDNAISSLRSVVNDDPKDFYAWTQIGNAYFLKKDFKNAEDAYSHAIAIRPAYVLASVNLGKLYLSQNENDKAIEILTKTVEADPTSADAQQYLGEAYLAIKKGSRAVGYLNEAIRLAPIEKAEVHLRLAALYNGAGLKPRASAEYQKFLEKVPSYEKRDELKKYIAENPPPQ